MSHVIFKAPTVTLEVELSQKVVSTLRAMRQQTLYQNERAGQLFGHVKANRAVVLDATGPRPSDAAGPTWYEIDRDAAQKEIDRHYERGLHFLGDWHTHPQNTPQPSLKDVENARSLFATSKHGLNAIVMLIVGSIKEPAAWWCSLQFEGAHIPLAVAVFRGERRQ